ncbi:transposase [Desulfolucanica intricata]|uniref:transposase n=1 Tax=Desulfolucanica intricata TaxID=1285191 RepID=UPI0009ED0BFF
MKHTKKLKACFQVFPTIELSFSYRLNCYILNISYKYGVPEQATSTVMGIDLGINNLAVLAVSGQIIKFFNGKRHNQKRNHYAELRRKLGRKNCLKRLKLSAIKNNGT